MPFAILTVLSRFPGSAPNEYRADTLRLEKRFQMIHLFLIRHSKFFSLVFPVQVAILSAAGIVVGKEIDLTVADLIFF